MDESVDAFFKFLLQVAEYSGKFHLLPCYLILANKASRIFGIFSVAGCSMLKEVLGITRRVFCRKVLMTMANAGDTMWKYACARAMIAPA